MSAPPSLAAKAWGRLRARLGDRIPGEPRFETRWWLSAARRRSAKRLAAMKDAHAGERCFIIGNGPSLRQMDLSPLRDEVTFGLNRIFLLFPELGWHTRYLVAVNPLVIEQSAREIASLPMPKFISWRGIDHPVDSPDTIFLRTRGIGFSRDPAKLVYESATVTHVALQLAYHMGFRQAILVGVDHNFVTKGDPHKTVVSEGPDPNHFHPDYFGKGFRWQLPDLETSEIGYRLARDAYREAGREVLDATVGGKLDVFPKIDYRTLFPQPSGGGSGADR